MKKDITVKCYFIKSPDGYYGKEFLEVNEKNKKTEIEQLEWPYKYPDGLVTYKIVSHSDDKSKKIQTKAVVVGVRAIGLHIKNIKFKRERNNSKNTDIDIYFTHKDPEFVKNYGSSNIENKEIVALIAYLQRLGTDIKANKTALK